MMQNSMQGRTLVQLGLFLVLLGLPFTLVFLGRPVTPIGMVDHLDACLNGIFLISLGLIWSRLQLLEPWRAVLFHLALYGTLAKWLVSLLTVWWVACGFSLSAVSCSQMDLLLQETLYDLSWLFLVVAALASCLLVVVNVYLQHAE